MCWAQTLFNPYPYLDNHHHQIIIWRSCNCTMWGLFLARSNLMLSSLLLPATWWWWLCLVDHDIYLHDHYHDHGNHNDDHHHHFEVGLSGFTICRIPLSHSVQRTGLVRAKLVIIVIIISWQSSFSSLSLDNHHYHLLKSEVFRKCGWKDVRRVRSKKRNDGGALGVGYAPLVSVMHASLSHNTLQITLYITHHYIMNYYITSHCITIYGYNMLAFVFCISHRWQLFQEKNLQQRETVMHTVTPCLAYLRWSSSCRWWGSTSYRWWKWNEMPYNGIWDFSFTR